jgi:hypothetical protein
MYKFTKENRKLIDRDDSYVNSDVFKIIYFKTFIKNSKRQIEKNKYTKNFSKNFFSFSFMFTKTDYFIK